MPEARFFGVLRLGTVLSNGGHPDGGVVVALGMRNSVDKSMRAGVCIGESVTVCDNMDFLGDIVVFHKHTPRIHTELPYRIADAFKSIPRYVEQRGESIDRLRRTTITDAQAHDTIIRSLDAGAIGLRELPKVLSQWRSDQTAERFGDHTAWALLNVCTEVKKDRFERWGTQVNAAARETMKLNAMVGALVAN
jgi:hypothetical protein